MSKLFDLECALTESRGITKNAKYIDLMEITSRLSGLAEVFEFAITKQSLLEKES